jgi:molybdenum cofactor cytidylyltransferase
MAQDHKYRIAGVVLAAGSSSRMGTQNKLLSEIHGRTILNHTLANLKASKVDEIFVVLGHEADRVRASISLEGFHFIHNPHFARGMSTSLISGISALPRGVDGTLICLGDMPMVTSRMMDRLIRAFNPDKGCSICIPIYAGRRGNPVLWPADLFPEIKKLKGDVGARNLLSRHEDVVCKVQMDDPAVLMDIDTQEDLKAL